MNNIQRTDSFSTNNWMQFEQSKTAEEIISFLKDGLYGEDELAEFLSKLDPEELVQEGVLEALLYATAGTSEKGQKVVSQFLLDHRREIVPALENVKSQKKLFRAFLKTYTEESISPQSKILYMKTLFQLIEAHQETFKKSPDFSEDLGTVLRTSLTMSFDYFDVSLQFLAKNRWCLSDQKFFLPLVRLFEGLAFRSYSDLDQCLQPATKGFNSLKEIVSLELIQSPQFQKRINLQIDMMVGNIAANPFLGSDIKNYTRQWTQISWLNRLLLEPREINLAETIKNLIS